MKKNLTVLISLILSVGLCFSKESGKTVIGVLKGPSGIPMAHMMDTYEAEYETFAQANLLLPKLMKGEVDIGFLPPNAAAKVYNSSKGKVVIAAVCGNGMLNLITRDLSIEKFSDLSGETVYVAGQGATPEYLTRFLLAFYGLSDDVTLDFSIPNADIAPALISGKIKYAIVPEPFSTVATTKDSSIVRAINLQDEWAKVTGQNYYPMSVVAVNAEYARANSKSVQKFLNAYQKSVSWTVNNPEKAGMLVEKYELGLNASVAAKAIPNCAFTYKTAKKSRTDIESLLEIFMKFDKASVGDSLPDDKFYNN